IRTADEASSNTLGRPAEQFRNLALLPLYFLTATTNHRTRHVFGVTHELLHGMAVRLDDGLVERLDFSNGNYFKSAITDDIGRGSWQNVAGNPSEPVFD